MTLTRITRVVPCGDLERQAACHRDVLGFALGFQAETDAVLRREAAAVRLIKGAPEVDLTAPEREGAFFIDVARRDALDAEMAPRRSALPQGRVRAPVDQA